MRYGELEFVIGCSVNIATETWPEGHRDATPVRLYDAEVTHAANAGRAKYAYSNYVYYDMTLSMGLWAP